MNHLREEQFELAMRERLRRAFTPIHAPDELSEKVKRTLRVRIQPADKTKPAHHIASRWRYWMPAAAAVLLVFLIIVAFAPSSAMAAPELAQIHYRNLDHDHMFFAESDPVQLAGYFRRNLGFHPLFPKNGQGLALRGCCVQHFRGKQVGSYVVDTPDGVISIIVVPDTLRQLGMKGAFTMSGHQFGTSAFATNNMAAVRIGQFTYCAVGKIPHEYLTRVLVQLLGDVEN